MAYAIDTKTPVEKSRAEIETLLMRAGAKRFAFMHDEQAACIGFILNDVTIRFELPLPDRADKQFWKTNHRTPRQLSQREAYDKWEQACRSKWRALLLCIRAKLEAIESGITTFEQEFLAHIVLHGGQTVGQQSIPRIKDAVRSGNMPVLALEFGGR